MDKGIRRRGIALDGALGTGRGVDYRGSVPTAVAHNRPLTFFCHTMPFASLGLSPALCRAASELERFLASHDLPVLTHLRDTQLYVQLAAHGMTLFDIAPARAAKDLEQWQPIIDWVNR